MKDTIYIMWKREVKKYWRSKPRLLGSLGQPILFLIALGLGFGPIFKQAGAGNYIQFLVPGIIGMTILFGSIFNGISLIWDKEFGFLKETLVAPVSRTSILIGRCLGGATIATFQGLIVLSLSFLLGFKISNLIQIIPLTILMMLISLLFALLGTIIASKLEDMHAFQLIMNFIVMPLFFLSGALFPLENLPQILSTIIRLNPLSYGVDGLRAISTGTTTFGLSFDFTVLLSLTTILLIIGNRAFKKIEV